MGSGSFDASGPETGGAARVKAVFLGDEAKSKEETRLVKKLGEAYLAGDGLPFFRC
jgi:hypothetical protein